MINPELFANWVKESPKTYDQIGADLKTTGTTIYRYITGRRHPSDEMRLRIESYTDGQVPYISWIQEQQTSPTPASPSAAVDNGSGHGSQ